VVIKENGRRKTITKLAAAARQLVNQVISGDLRALQQLVALARFAEERSPEAGASTAFWQLPNFGNSDDLYFTRCRRWLLQFPVLSLFAPC
jgi:uncharacterized protein DUF5681